MTRARSGLYGPGGLYANRIYTGPTLDVGMPTITLVDDPAAACGAISRARDDRTFSCARPRGHKLEHYGRDSRGPVRLGFGR